MDMPEKFGDLLRRLIKESGMSQSAFYMELGMAKAYFYEILSGKVNPPPAETQLKIVDILSCDQETSRYFYDTAAKERGEFPADIMSWAEKEPNAFTYIRSIMPVT